MPNIASVLRQEICRLAKKEVKAQVGKTQKASAQYRRDIANLKRQLGQQEREIKLLKKQPKMANLKPKRSLRRTFVFRLARSRPNEAGWACRLPTMASWSACRD